MPKGRRPHTNLPRKRTGFAIVGLASHHSEFIALALQSLPETFLVGAYDEDTRRARKFCGKFNTKYFSDLDVLLRDPDVEIGVVTGENSRKGDLSIAIARAQKHVLCDKPLGISARESRDIINSCRKARVRLQVGYVSRYVEEVQRARRFTMSHKLGKVRFTNVENRVDSGLVKQLSPWLMKKGLAGGGALLEHSVHAIDLALWFNESPPRSVFAVSAKNLDNAYDLEDNFAILIQFQNESIALIDGS